MPYKSIELQTEDGITLEGWYLEQTVRGKPSERIVLLCNPYNHDKSTLLAVARALWDTGHSVLLFDFRAFGPTPSKHETIGFLEMRDGRAALAWLRANKPSEAKIGIMGCSMGGAVALSLVEEDDAEIVGVATDCAFANLGDVVKHYVESSLSPRIPGRNVMSRIVVESLALCNKFIYDYDLTRVGPGARLKRLRVPLLIVHSELDSIVPLHQAEKIMDGAKTPGHLKRLVVIKGCEHIGSFFQNEIQYTKRIVSFLDMCFEDYPRRLKAGGDKQNIDYVNADDDADLKGFGQPRITSPGNDAKALPPAPLQMPAPAQQLKSAKNGTASVVVDQPSSAIKKNT